MEHRRGLLIRLLPFVHLDDGVHIGAVGEEDWVKGRVRVARHVWTYLAVIIAMC